MENNLRARRHVKEYDFRLLLLSAAHFRSKKFDAKNIFMRHQGLVLICFFEESLEKQFNFKV